VKVYGSRDFLPNDRPRSLRVALEGLVIPSDLIKLSKYMGLGELSELMHALIGLEPGHL